MSSMTARSPPENVTASTGEKAFLLGRDHACFFGAKLLIFWTMINDATYNGLASAVLMWEALHTFGGLTPHTDMCGLDFISSRAVRRWIWSQRSNKSASLNGVNSGKQDVWSIKSILMLQQSESVC
jgi:hypothetical protein